MASVSAKEAAYAHALDELVALVLGDPPVDVGEAAAWATIVLALKPRVTVDVLP